MTADIIDESPFHQLERTLTQLAVTTHQLAQVCEALRAQAEYATPTVEAGILNVAEVAKIMRCSGSSVRRAIDDDGLPAFRLGTQVRIPRYAFEQWLQERALESA